PVQPRQKVAPRRAAPARMAEGGHIGRDHSGAVRRMRQAYAVRPGGPRRARWPAHLPRVPAPGARRRRAGMEAVVPDRAREARAPNPGHRRGHDSYRTLPAAAATVAVAAQKGVVTCRMLTCEARRTGPRTARSAKLFMPRSASGASAT